MNFFLMYDYETEIFKDYVIVYNEICVFLPQSIVFPGVVRPDKRHLIEIGQQISNKPELFKPRSLTRLPNVETTVTNL